SYVAAMLPRCGMVAVARKYRNLRVPGPVRDRGALTRRDAARSIRSQPKSSYQEWQRDRPDEATTTYRRIGKVPSPGRPSCTIRETPFGAPLSGQGGRPPPVPRQLPYAPENPWRSRSFPPPLPP